MPPTWRSASASSSPRCPGAPGRTGWRAGAPPLAGPMAALPATIAEAAAWLRDGRTTSTALTEALLERAHAAQPGLGAFVAFTDASALAAARQADADFAAGVDRGPLQGVPLGV